MNYDAMNAVFEGGSACLLTLNVRRLYKDKKLAGISILPTTWFSLWGVWNLVYYSKLNQALSLAAGIAVLVLNSAWVFLAIYYSLRNKRCR